MAYTQGGSVFPAGFQRISDEPRQIFYDPFDAALDTTNTWTTPTSGNSAVLAAIASGVLSIGTGTTASGWSKLFSQGTFKLSIPAWTGFSFAINLPDGAAPTVNSYRFWGSGTPATTPTTAAPMTDAVGFEIDIAGKMYAVVYAAGVRTAIADLSSSGTNTQPLNTSSHRYIVYVRTDKTYWYIDGLGDAQLVATSNFQSPAIQTLPISLVAVGGATPPASNTQIQCTGLAVWDTGKNATQIADGTYPWRKAQISATGAVKVDNSGSTQNALVAGSAIIGAVKSAVVQQATTNLTALNQAQTFTLQGESGMSIQLTGTWTATVTFEASNDNTNWSSVNVQRAGDNVLSQTVANSTNNDVYRLGISGFLYARTRCSAYTSGTIVVTSSTSIASSSTVLTAPLPAGTNNIGTVGVVPQTTGGLTTYHLVSAATTNATVIKASAGQVFGWYIYNANATARKVAFHNTASTPTAGASIFLALVIPPLSAANVFGETGIAFSTGIAITTVTEVLDSGNTTVSLNDLNINIFYK